MTCCLCFQGQRKGSIITVGSKETPPAEGAKDAPPPPPSEDDPAGCQRPPPTETEVAQLPAANRSTTSDQDTPADGVDTTTLFTLPDPDVNWYKQSSSEGAHVTEEPSTQLQSTSDTE